MCQNEVGESGTDDAQEILTGRAPHAGDAAERRQQRLAPARADAGDGIQLRPQIALGAPLTMERHREAMRLVSNPLDEEQRRALARQRNRDRAGPS